MIELVKSNNEAHIYTNNLKLLAIKRKKDYYAFAISLNNR